MRTKGFIWGSFLYVGFLILSWAMGIDGMFLAVLTVWLLAFIYSMRRLQSRVLLAAFLVSFFVFLVGGHFVYEYFGMEIKYYFGEEYYFHSNLCMFISLSFLLIGSICNSAFRIRTGKTFNKLNNLSYKKPDFSNERNTRNLQRIKYVSRLLFYITSPFWLYTAIDVVSFVLSNSYTAYYVEYESNAPYIIKAIAATTPYFYYTFLATMPTKKECKWPMIIYLLYAVLSLFTGRRINLIVMVMFTVVYFIFRHYSYGEKEVWIKKKYIIIVAIAVPVLIVFLYAWNFIRAGTTVTEISLKDMFLGFFQQQGFSSSLMRLELYHESSLRDDAYYSLFGIVKYFRTNSIFKLIFNPQYGFSYLHNSVAFATLGNSLSNSLSYLVLRGYLAGAGLGTCYIAELYHDFGYVGVALGNLIYGYVISFIGQTWNKVKSYNVWITAIGFAMVESFIKAPRWNFDIFVAYFLGLGMWMSFIAVYILANLVKDSNAKK